MPNMYIVGMFHYLPRPHPLHVYHIFDEYSQAYFFFILQLGLWEACFKDFSHKTSYNGKLYNGCWWMFSYEYEPIRDWLNPRE